MVTPDILIVQEADFSKYEDEKRSVNLAWDVLKGVLNVCGSTVIISYMLSSSHCMLREEVGKSHLVSGSLAAAGFSNIILEIFSNNLRVSGATRMGYVICVLIFFNQEELTCPGSGDIYAMGVTERTHEWQQRLQMVQGAVIIACIAQFFSGILGTNFLIKYIRPVSIAPVMLLISIFVIKTTAVVMANTCWNLFIFTCVVILVSYCISNYLSRREKDTRYINLNFRNRLYLGTLSVLMVWTICVAFSSIDFIQIRSAARTDVYTGALNYAPSLHLSYPFLWGIPKWRIDGIFIVLVASFVSIFEILANYYKSLLEGDSLRKSKEELSTSTWNALITWEALFCLLTSTMSTALGIEIELKRNDQKYFGFFVGIILCLIALSGKLCSLFVMIPEPIVAALILLVFTSVFFEGLAMLQYINMKSTKNLFIFGTSLFLGIVIPALSRRGQWKDFTAQTTIDEILLCFLSTEFFVAGFVAVILDNITKDVSSKKSELSEMNNLNINEKLYSEDSMVICDCLPPCCI